MQAICESFYTRSGARPDISCCLEGSWKSSDPLDCGCREPICDYGQGCLPKPPSRYACSKTLYFQSLVIDLDQR